MDLHSLDKSLPRFLISPLLAHTFYFYVMSSLLLMRAWKCGHLVAFGHWSVGVHAFHLVSSIFYSTQPSLRSRFGGVSAMPAGRLSWSVVLSSFLIAFESFRLPQAIALGGIPVSIRLAFRIGDRTHLLQCCSVWSIRSSTSIRSSWSCNG